MAGWMAGWEHGELGPPGAVPAAHGHGPTRRALPPSIPEPFCSKSLPAFPSLAAEIHLLSPMRLF